MRNSRDIFDNEIVEYPGSWKPDEKDKTPSVKLKLKRKRKFNHIKFLLTLNEDIELAKIKIIDGNKVHCFKRFNLKRGFYIWEESLKDSINSSSLLFVFDFTIYNFCVHRIYANEKNNSVSEVKFARYSDFTYLYECQLNTGSELDFCLLTWNGKKVINNLDYKFYLIENKKRSEIVPSLDGKMRVLMNKSDLKICCYTIQGELVDMFMVKHSTCGKYLKIKICRIYENLIDEFILRYRCHKYSYKIRKLKG